MRQGLERLQMHFFHDKTLFAEIQVAKAQAAKVQVARSKLQRLTAATIYRLYLNAI
jgi:hypothetical protein